MGQQRAGVPRHPHLLDERDDDGPARAAQRRPEHEGQGDRRPGEVMQRRGDGHRRQEERQKGKEEYPLELADDPLHVELHPPLEHDHEEGEGPHVGGQGKKRTTVHQVEDGPQDHADAQQDRDVRQPGFPEQFPAGESGQDDEAGDRVYGGDLHGVPLA